MDIEKIEKLTQDSQSLKLLYVEDNQQARESTLSALDIFFQDITIAVDGEDGLNAFRKGNFDIIITDINMPKMNGIDMVYKIREVDEDVTIIVLSAYDDKMYCDEITRAGISGYILKPIDLNKFIDIMVEAVDRILQKKKKA